MLTDKTVIKSVNHYVDAINKKHLRGYTADGLESKQFDVAWEMADGLIYDEHVNCPFNGLITRDDVFNEMREHDYWMKTGDANICMIAVNALIADGYTEEAVRLNYAMFIECAVDMVWDAAEDEAGVCGL